MDQPHRLPMSEEDFLALPETMDRVELIDGEVYVAPSPTFEHQELLARVAELLRGWARARPPAIALVSPLDIRMGEGRILQPDAVLWIGGLADRRMPLTTIPDLVVAVLSGKPSHDRLAKKLIYAEAGVREYWIVDSFHRTLEVAHGLVTRAPSKQPFESEVAEGLAVDVGALFEGV